MHLTDISIRALKPPASGQRDYWDDGLPGFGVRVSQGGTKSFVMIHDGDRRRLGRFPEMSLADARKEARRLRARKELGHMISSATADEAIQSFIVQHVEKNLRPSSQYEAKRVLNKHFKFGRKRLDAIRATDIMRTIDVLPRSAANHAFAHIRTFLRWCVRRQYIDRSPLDMMKLPNKTLSRDRVLTDEELKIVWKVAQDFPFPFGHIVALLITTGQRLGEITALKWDYIDRQGRTVTLPPAIVKNNTIHCFPFGDIAADVIGSIDQFCVFLFPARDHDKPYDGHNKAKAKFEIDCDAVWAEHVGDEDARMAHWTLHDLRRTFATIHARIGTPPHVAEALLNHKTGTRTSIQRVYDRHTYLPEMRVAMSNYDRYLAELFRPETADALADFRDRSC